MSDDLVTRLRDWRTVYPCDADAPEGWLYMQAAARIEELETELRETQDHANALAAKEYYTEIRAERAEAKLEKAIRVVELICGPDWDNRLGEAIDLGCEILSEKGQDDE